MLRGLDAPAETFLWDRLTVSLEFVQLRSRTTTYQKGKATRLLSILGRVCLCGEI